MYPADKLCIQRAHALAYFLMKPETFQFPFPFRNGSDCQLLFVIE